MKNTAFFISFLLLLSCNTSEEKNQTEFKTFFEKSSGTATPEYKDVIAYYAALADAYPEISLFSFGQTDAGEPLHLVVYSAEGIYNIDEIRDSKKTHS